MAKELVADAFWERVKHLIPPKKPQPKGGRPWRGQWLEARKQGQIQPIGANRDPSTM